MARLQRPGSWTWVYNFGTHMVHTFRARTCRQGVLEAQASVLRQKAPIPETPYPVWILHVFVSILCRKLFSQKELGPGFDSRRLHQSIFERNFRIVYEVALLFCTADDPFFQRIHLTLRDGTDAIRPAQHLALGKARGTVGVNGDAHGLAEDGLGEGLPDCGGHLEAVAAETRCQIESLVT